MKYCCNKFEEALKRNKQSYPNIRIVKFISEFLVNPAGVVRLSEDIYFHNEKTKPSPYRFYITTGYTTFNLDIPSFNINFCPFCCSDLYSFYKEDIYANEIEGITFPLIVKP